MYYFISPSLKGVRSSRSFGRRIRRPGAGGRGIQPGRTGWKVLRARVSNENERRLWMWGRRGGCLAVGRSARCSLDSCDTRRSHASPPTPPAGLAPLAPGPGASPDRLLHPACKTCSFAEKKLESEVGGVWPLPLPRLIPLNRLELPFYINPSLAWRWCLQPWPIPTR